MLCLLFVYPFSNGLVKAFHTNGSKKDANGRYGKTKRSLSVKKMRLVLYKMPMWHGG